MESRPPGRSKLVRSEPGAARGSETVAPVGRSPMERNGSGGGGPGSNGSGGGKASGGGGIAGAAGTVVFYTLLSRVLGMARDSIIAAQFGSNWQTDAYTAAFKIPDLLYYLIAGGALSSTFVPVFSDYWLHNKSKAAWKTFSVVATVTFIVATFFVVAAEFKARSLVILLNQGYAPVGHRLHFSGFVPHLEAVPRVFHSEAERAAFPRKLDLAVRLTRIVLPAQIFFLLGGLLIGTQNARNQFRTAALAPSVYNIGIILGALVLNRLGFGISGLMWGALAGAFVGNFAMQIVPVMRLGAVFRPSLSVSYPGAVRVWKLMLPILLGVSLPNVDQIINTSFASNLPGDGPQTDINYANRIMLIPIGVFAQAMGIAILPTMSRLAAAGDKKELRRTINKGLRTILFLTVPASTLMVLLAVPIVSVLYQHHKFTYEMTLQTADPLRWYAVGIFAWSAQAILTRGFYALNDSVTPVVSGTLMTILFIVMNAFVVDQTQWGIAGLALATTIAATSHTIVLYTIMSRRMRGLLGGRLFWCAVRVALSTAALGAVVYWVRYGTAIVLGFIMPHPESWQGALVTLALAGGGGLTAFILMSRLLRAPELADFAPLAARLKGAASSLLRMRRRGAAT